MTDGVEGLDWIFPIYRIKAIQRTCKGTEVILHREQK
jgi:hypothetical protein